MILMSDLRVSSSQINATAPAKTKRSVIIKRMKDSWQLYLIILPVVVYVFIFSYMPLYGIQLAFRHFNPGIGIWGSPWVGFDNFTRFFNSIFFERIVVNTLALNVYGLIAGFPFPIIIALMFNEIKNARTKKAVQTIVVAPHFIAMVVMVGMLNLFFSVGSGFVNNVIEAFGGEAIPFMTGRSYFRSMFVWSDVWQRSGWNSIIYIAALAGVDPELHEAARIDGASKLKRIWHVNLPAIRPTIVILLILQFGSMMNVGFEKAFLMQNTQNIAVSEVIATYVFRVGITNADFSFATTVGLFNNIINVILLLIVNKICSRVSETSLF